MTHHIFGYGPGQADVLLPLSTHSSFIRAAFEQGLLGARLPGPRPRGHADLRPDPRPAAARRERRRHCGAPRHLGRADREQLLHRHHPLAPHLDRRGADLVRLLDGRRGAKKRPTRRPSSSRSQRQAPDARSQGSPRVADRNLDVDAQSSRSRSARGRAREHALRTPVPSRRSGRQPSRRRRPCCASRSRCGRPSDGSRCCSPPPT